MNNLFFIAFLITMLQKT